MDLLDGIWPRNNPHTFVRGAIYQTSYGHAKVTHVSTGGLASFVILAPSDEAKAMGWKKGATFVAHPDDNTAPSPRSWLMIKSPYHGAPSVCIASYCGKKARAGKTMCTEHLKTHPLRPRPDLRNNPRKPGKYPGYEIQTILIPMKYDSTKAREIAARHGSRPVAPKAEGNFWHFRQRDPKLMTRKYVTLKLPHATIVKALPKSVAKRAKIADTSKKLTTAERKRLLALDTPRHNPAKLPSDAFRKPDRSSHGVSVWYGPGGKRTAEQATEVEDEGNGTYTVSEYQHVGGYFDEYDEDYPFLKTSTTVEAKSAREAAQLGSTKIQQRGGDESMESDLP